jgi:3-dehydroquinate synthase
MKNIKNMAIKIQSTNYEIEIGSILTSSFYDLITNRYQNRKKIIMVDENTHDCCLEFLITTYDSLSEAEVILIPEGEENKVMEVCLQIWSALSEFNISRRDLVINLGGGIITDMGGVIASLYKRGVNFVNIPTSLLAMVDASVGGKTGVNLDHFKNQLGVFSNPIAVFVDPSFLSTLPLSEVKNGFAEMLKHGLIADKNHWDVLKCMLPSEDIFGEKIISESILIKNQIVLSDEKEKNERKKLNFGHTVGHAIETYFMSSENTIKHGHAVAIGMLAESYLSNYKKLLSDNELKEIETTICQHFEIPDLAQVDSNVLFEIMSNDKKNFDSKIQCTLLKEIGVSLIHQEISFVEVNLSLEYLKSLKH